MRLVAVRLTVLALAALNIVAAADPPVVYLREAPSAGSTAADPAERVRLSDGGDHVVSNIHNPSITVYLPTAETTTGAAVIIAPGGGHRELWTDHEGHTIARRLSERGVAAFVLYYRLAREEGSSYSIEGDALDDIQRAVQLVRARAADWNVDPARVGVMGFSAGGEIAALAAVRPLPGDPQAVDPVARLSATPAFQALVYPAIPKQMALSAQTPPAFLVCGENDRKNIAEGLPELYLELKRAGASAELHVYADVGHGFGMRDRLTGPVSGWLDSFHGWLGTIGMLSK